MAFHAMTLGCYGQCLAMPGNAASAAAINSRHAAFAFAAVLGPGCKMPAEGAVVP